MQLAVKIKTFFQNAYLMVMPVETWATAKEKIAKNYAFVHRHGKLNKNEFGCKFCRICHLGRLSVIIIVVLSPVLHLIWVFYFHVLDRHSCQIMLPSRNKISRSSSSKPERLNF